MRQTNLGGTQVTTSIGELKTMSHEEAEHRCFERMIDAAVLDLKLETAIRYQWMELVLTQTGESL